MEAFTILVKLFCAHLCADFIFQTNSINAGKHREGIVGISFQLLHSMIHASVAYLLVADWSCWLIPLVIFTSHFIIDTTKCKLHKNSLTIFLTDQVVHIAIIGILWFLMYGEKVEFSYLDNIHSAHFWIVAVSYILMLKPSSILLGLFLAHLQTSVAKV